MELLGENVLEQYVFEVENFVSSYNEITFVYSKYINDIKTNDGIYISLNLDGSLSSFSATKQGMFDELDISIEKIDVEKYAKDYLEREMGIDDYRIENILIDKTNENFEINIYVSYENGKYISSDIITYYL